MKNKLESADSLCYCESGNQYSVCCQPMHKGIAASTAEQLMRSRYSAYVLGLEDYLLSTWHTNTRPTSLDLNSDAGTMRWVGLQVKYHELIDNNHAIVEFIARYKLNGKAHKLHESSRFIKQDGQWLYIDGEMIE